MDARLAPPPRSGGGAPCLPLRSSWGVSGARETVTLQSQTGAESAYAKVCLSFFSFLPALPYAHRVEWSHLCHPNSSLSLLLHLSFAVFLRNTTCSASTRGIRNSAVRYWKQEDELIGGKITILFGVRISDYLSMV